MRPPRPRAGAIEQVAHTGILVASAVLLGVFPVVPGHRQNLPEQAVGLIIDAGGKEQLVGISERDAIAEPYGPQPIVDEGLPVTAFELTLELAVREIERVDPPVAEVADEHLIAQLAEISRGHRQTPRRIEGPARREAPDLVALRIENVHEPVSLARDIIVPGGIL